MESKIVKEIVEEYELKDGMEIDLSCLDTISKRKGIEIKDLFRILGIYKVGEYINMKRALAKDTYIIHIYTEEDYNKIEEEIRANFEKRKDITYFQFMRLQKKYKIAGRKLKNILGITNREYERLKSKEQKANIQFEQEEVSRESYQIREELKYFDKITLNQLEEVKEKYSKSYKELRIILKVEKTIYSKFIHKEVQTLKINLLSNKEKMQLKEKIVQMCQGKDYLTKSEIGEIQKETKASNCIMQETLSIHSQNFNLLMSNKIQMTRIIFSDINRKAFLLKMDCIYYDAKKFHTKKELLRRTKKMEIPFDAFLKNLHSNIKHYPYNLLALERNKKGLYIGREHPMSNWYIEEKQEEIKKIIQFKFWQYHSMYPFKYDEENIKEEVFFRIVEKGGILEKNFSFDEKLFMSLITNKIKYFIWNECQKVRRRQTYLNQYQYELVNTYQIDENNDKKTNQIVQLFQEEIYLSILMYLKEYEDMIRFDKKSAYELIAKKMQVEYTLLIQKLEVIQNRILGNKLAKRCKNGTIIIMTEKTVF